MDADGVRGQTRARTIMTPEQPAADRNGARVRRRDLLIGLAATGVGLAVGGVAGWLANDLRGDRWPGPLGLGNARQLLAEIEATEGPLIRPEDWSPTVAVIRWDPGLPRARELYAVTDHAITDDDEGLMVLSLRDPHLGCRVQWCATSRWFENPCHGEKYNRWGEWMAGPAPRGLDRYASYLIGDELVVDLGRLLLGPDREAHVLDQEPEGRHCVD